MSEKKVKTQNDFSKGPVWKCIIVQAVPLTIAQLVQLLYNVVDRIYLGHMEEGSSLALTGVGLTFPIITLIMAFTVLFGNGGVPLFSMARGGGETEEAEKIVGTSFDSAVERFYRMAYAAVMEGQPLDITPEHAAQVIRVIEECHAANPLPVKFL